MQLERAQSAKQPQSMPPATRGELEKAVEIAREIRNRERFNKLDFYDPYPYQKSFPRNRLRGQPAPFNGC